MSFFTTRQSLKVQKKKIPYFIILIINLRKSLEKLFTKKSFETLNIKYLAKKYNRNKYFLIIVKINF